MAEYRRQFLSVARQKVLHQLISGWHRRGATLLQVGLNAGFSPEFFWEAGFDVTAMDRSPACIDAAREQTGPRVEYVCGVSDLLPFDNGVFDYAVLVHPVLKEGEAGRSVLEEALRVAARGIIIMEWNSFSLAGAPKSVQSRWAGPGLGEGGEAQAVNFWELYGMVRRACPGRSVSLVSALPLWEGTWPDGTQGLRASLRRAAAPLNLAPLPLPVGALMGMRVDWAPVPLTPIGMLKSAAASLCAPPKRAREEAMGRVCHCEAEETLRRRDGKRR
ncbi:class I SAM-dependent methyltransferase [Mailhella massiliensis]|uniref:class I SAM-dependent methyltransferase n=1 Tax=Mailhella massiliensis TaxID=1903261 RepID=UPI002352E060|nr:methyltransferase domain-containing protein [Mailhella massiliensis]